MACSVLVPSAPQALEAVHPATKSVVLASNYAPANFTQSLNQDLYQNPVKTTVMTTTVKIKHAQTENSQDATKSPDKSSQPVKIAWSASRIALPEMKQISRGSSGTSTIVEHALSLLGAPYVFGGTTRSGFDCSGFTQYILALSGISIPRSSYEQFASGVAVSRDALQPGDLVFFTTYAKGASHVGIYIGGGRFVQADNPQRGVTITNLSNSFYSSHYLGARRYE